MPPFSGSASAIQDFNAWLGELPHKHRIVIAGNHEYFLEADLTKRSLISNATVLIDEAIEVLVTHTPPYGILDCSPGALHHSGCPELREAVERIRPQLHIFGHIHGAHGMFTTEHTVYVNASMLGPDGDIAYSPIILRMPQR
jgi:Icc-related predicted phosphoesterase